MKIDTVTVNPEKVALVQDNYFSFINWSATDKTYYSTDRTKALALKWDLEIPWGPSLYLARLFEVMPSGKVNIIKNFSQLLFGRKRFIAPQDFRNPWSSDSKNIALIEVKPENKEFTVHVYDIANAKLISIKKHHGFFSYYMWSPDSNYYLFGDLKNIYIYSLDSQTSRVVSETFEQAPKHCYFSETGEFIVLLKDTMMQILSSKSSDVLAESSLREYLESKETIDVSMWDPFEKRIILGVNMYALDGNKVKCKKWLGVKLA